MSKRVIAIDAGNTSLKVGIFENDKLINVERHSLESLADNLTSFGGQVIISSVVSDNDLVKIQSLFTSSKVISTSSPSPCPSSYATMNTLGVDRFCNANYAFRKSTTEAAVVIDIGTCIKFDVVTKADGYIGGSISPGADLRFKSMNDYTGKLPLLSNKSEVDTVGGTTEESMRSGVINGITAEINGFMNTYRMKFGDLTFFVTGGDADFFELESKNDIFADENLTLIGLYEVYKYNA
jgi:type III pantothenate kinase